MPPVAGADLSTKTSPVETRGDINASFVRASGFYLRIWRALRGIGNSNRRGLALPLRGSIEETTTSRAGRLKLKRGSESNHELGATFRTKSNGGRASRIQPRSISSADIGSKG